MQQSIRFFKKINKNIFSNLIDPVGTVFANSPGDLGSIQDFKNGAWYLLASHSAI